MTTHGAEEIVTGYLPLCGKCTFENSAIFISKKRYFKEHPNCAKRESQ